MNNKGVALILVVSILTVIAITVVSFIFTMRLESRAASNYLWQEKARYLAEAGIVHAKQILREDKNNDFIDSYLDAWRTTFSGTDIDNNDDGDNDSAWIEVEADGEVIGRYAVLVEDEAAKININTAGFHNESAIKATHGASTFEVSLKDFLSAQGVSGASNVAGAIIEYRYGQDQAPGEKSKDDNNNAVSLANDATDNDADGEIDESDEGTDEPQEFSFTYPYGDDQPFLAKEQLQEVDEVSSGIYQAIQAKLSAYSQSVSSDKNRELQWDINSLDAQQVLDVFLRSGVSSAWQKAVNLVDAADEDFAQSTVVKSSLTYNVSNQGPNGDWEWASGRYESKTYGGLPGTWLWTDIDAGGYYLILYGIEGTYLGDVTVGELTQRHMRSGDTFNIFPSGTIEIADAGGGTGSLTVSIQNNESLGTSCYFQSMELVSAEGKVLGSIEEVKGVEGIRINEFMPQPQLNYSVSAAQTPGGDWFWQDSYYINAAPGEGATGEGTWIWEDIPDGSYYLTVYGNTGNDVVGDVTVNGATQENMQSGNLFTARPTVTVNNGIFRIDIQNNRVSGSCYFKSVALSQQPDGEYVELVNLTPNAVSLDGWTLEATSTDGWPATIPLGTTIEPGEYLILAVDKDDSISGLEDNGISFTDIWGALACAQLDFSRSVSSYSDLIDDAPTNGGEIILRDASGNTVDSQEYTTGLVEPYLSLEKGDPTLVGVATSVWFASDDLTGATAAKKNDNGGIIVVVDEQTTIEHDIDEVEIKNRPLANLGEIARVVSGRSWEKMSIADLTNLADRLTTYSLRLEAEGHKTEGAWSEVLRSAPQTSWFVSQNQNEIGTWVWNAQDRVENGVYNLYVYGQQDEAIALSLYLADGSWSAFTPALTPATNGAVNFGRIDIGGEDEDALPENTLGMQVKNLSANNIAHFDYIRLAPLPYVAGKINLNTASKQVLQALPMIDSAAAQRIIDARPIGNIEERGRGIGDLLLEDTLSANDSQKLTMFGALSNLVTVRSDTFQIIATAQSLRNGRVMAERRITTIIER